MKFMFTFVGVVLSASASAAFAHDIMLLAKPGAKVELTARYGHPGDWQFFDKNKLIALDVMSAQGTTASLYTLIKPSGDHYVTQVDRNTSPCLITARYDNGYWVTFGDGTYRNARRPEVEGAVEALGSFKFAKAWLPAAGASAACSQSVGHRLEIVPMMDPAKAKPGQSFPVQVLWENVPLVGAGVEIGDGEMVRKEEDIPRYTTDAKGVAQIPISRSGWQIIGVDFDTVPRIPALSDKDKFVATFSFWLPAP